MRTLSIGAAVLLASLLAGCGGGGNDSTTDPSSSNYDPATATLQKAGLESCSQDQLEVPAHLEELPGLGLTRTFYVAKDCKGAKVTPNTMIVYQFTNLDDFTAGAKKIELGQPKAATDEHYPLVIAATGPDKEANLAAVIAQLPPTSVTTTSG